MDAIFVTLAIPGTWTIVQLLRKFQTQLEEFCSENGFGFPLFMLTILLGIFVAMQTYDLAAETDLPTFAAFVWSGLLITYILHRVVPKKHS